MESAARQLDTALYIDTPENVSFRYRLAGPFLRLPAFLIDVVVRALAMSILALFLWAFRYLVPIAFPLTLSVMMICWFALEWFYGAILEGVWNGQTIGKRAMGLRVVSANGRPVNLTQAILRNLLRYVDLMPFVSWPFGVEVAGLAIIPTCGVGLLASFFGGRLQRVGDVIAGTVVVIHIHQDLLVAAPDLPTPPTTAFDKLPHHLTVTRRELELIEAYCERMHELHPSRRQQLVASLVDHWRRRYDLSEDVSADMLIAAMKQRLGRTGSRGSDAPLAEIVTVS